MSYVVTNTEKTRSRGAEFETKALLYLMSCRHDSSEISVFAIDFFNDVTGLNDIYDKAWDVQAKGNSRNTSKEIGKELVTLFKNYVSELNFDTLILFLASVPDSLRIDSSLNVFGIENINNNALESINKGLTEEALHRLSVNSNLVTDENILAFLRKVTFVVDDKSKADYVRGIFNISEKYMPDEDSLERVFVSIRSMQSEIKENRNVEGVTVNSLGDALCFGRCLESSKIRLKVLNSIINRDIMNMAIPTPFCDLIKDLDDWEKKDVIDDCKLKIASALFDKISADTFWKILGLIYNNVVEDKSRSTLDVYRLIEGEDVVLHNIRLDNLAVKYLISAVKEALM